MYEFFYFWILVVVLLGVAAAILSFFWCHTIAGFVFLFLAGGEVLVVAWFLFRAVM